MMSAADRPAASVGAAAGTVSRPPAEAARRAAFRITCGGPRGLEDGPKQWHDPRAPVARERTIPAVNDVNRAAASPKPTTAAVPAGIASSTHTATSAIITVRATARSVPAGRMFSSPSDATNASKPPLPASLPTEDTRKTVAIRARSPTSR